MFLTRLLRKRWVLLLIVTLSVLYLVVSIFSQSKSALYRDIELGQRVNVRRPFVWQPKSDNAVRNHSQTGCRNTVQGKILVVDDRGVVCKRSELLGNGCCMNVTGESVEGDAGAVAVGPTCSTCNAQGCCIMYEHCVSCCLRPDARRAPRDSASHPAAAPPADTSPSQAPPPLLPDTIVLLLSQAADHYEMCTVKCRTSSQSVYHETTYRDPKSKHCYGDLQPDLVTPLKK